MQVKNSLNHPNYRCLYKSTVEYYEMKFEKYSISMKIQFNTRLMIYVVKSIS